MNKNKMEMKVFSLYNIFLLVSAGFIGLFLVEDLMNNHKISIEAVTIVDINGKGNYTSIQAAIDNASTGDTIYVWEGTYYENLIVNKTITLIGNGTKNTIINGSGMGDVVVIFKDFVNISGFTLTGSGKGSLPDLLPKYCHAGIELNNINNVTIKNNNCSNNDFGIYLFNSSYNSISNNICNKNGKNGIMIYNFCSNNIIINNTYNFNNWVGIYIHLSYGIQLNYPNIIISNNCSNNSAGIVIENSAFNQLSNNIMLQNKRGLIFMNASNNTIKNNTISYNTEYGLRFYTGICKDNYISHNDIISNYIQVQIDWLCLNSSNTWNNSAQEGNYWSDYTGLDTGHMIYGWDVTNKHLIAGDGIGDTLVPHLGLDYYPFTNKLGWLKPGIPKLKDPGNIDSDGNYSITWNVSCRTVGYIIEEDNTSTFESPNMIYYGENLSFNITNKQNGSYFYRIRAYNNYGLGNWSNIENITVDWPPNIPKNLNVSVYPQGNKLNLTWDMNLIDTNQYILEFKNETMANWQQIDPILHPGFTYNHTGLIDGERYDYRIQARDHRGQLSNFSEIISGIPWDSVPPAPPTGLRVVSMTNDSISLNWNPNPEEDLEGYHLFRSELSNPLDWDESIGIILKDTEEYIDINLDELTTYYYVITAFDEIPNDSSYSNMAFGTTILGQHGPVINDSIEDFSIPEDTIDDSTIKLYRWFRDINNDVLEFKCEGNVNISVTIFQENGTVILAPKKDWNGKETLTFYANDSVYEMSDNVTITVTPVNDPPGPAIIITPQNKFEVENGTGINFTAICSDPDLIYDDKLTFNWSSNISGRIGSGENLTDIILIPGHHQISLEVSDIPGETAIDVVNITILPDLPGNNITPTYDLELELIPNEVMLYRGNQTQVKAIVTNLGNVDNIVTLTWDDIDISKIELSVNGSKSTIIGPDKTKEFEITIKAMDNAPTGALLINIEVTSEKVNENATLTVIIIEEKLESISKPDTVSENLWITVFLVIIVILILICIFLLMAKRKKRVKQKIQEKQVLPIVEAEIEKPEIAPTTGTPQEPLIPSTVQAQLPNNTAEEQVSTAIGQPPATEQIPKSELPQLPPVEGETTEPGTSEKTQEVITETSSLPPEITSISEPIAGEVQPQPAQINDELKESDESSDDSTTTSQE